MKDEIDILLHQINPQTPKDKWIRFIARNVPHKTDSKSHWCMPVWWCFIFGGTYDSGNGYGTKPNLYYTIRNGIRSWRIKRKEYKYWQEYYKKYGCQTQTGSSTKCSTDGGKTYHNATPL